MKRLIFECLGLTAIITLSFWSSSVLDFPFNVIGWIFAGGLISGGYLIIKAKGKRAEGK